MTLYNAQPQGDPRRGHWLNFSPNPGQVQHDFCGAHDIAGATCPYCNKPLLRILSLSAEDPVLNLEQGKTPVVHLLYCWTCSIPFGEFSYRINADGSVEFVHVPERQHDREFGLAGPFDGYKGVYPLCKVSLEPMDEQDDAKLARRAHEEGDEEYDDLFAPRHQVGGSPFIYNPKTLTCPGCSTNMPVLAAICDHASGNNPWQPDESNSFTGNGGAQMVFQFCRDCAIVSAYHSCD